MKHKEVIIAMANDEAVQWKSIQLAEWQEHTGKSLNPINDSHLDWRIKPKTIRVGNRDLPEPLRVAPAKESKCWLADPSVSNVAVWSWLNYETENRWLRRGLLHSTREAAEQWRDAFIELAGG